MKNGLKHGIELDFSSAIIYNKFDDIRDKTIIVNANIMVSLLTNSLILSELEKCETEYKEKEILLYKMNDNIVIIQKYTRGYLCRKRINSFLKTGESQEHGKAWEINIAKNIYSIDNAKDKYKGNAKYDIPAEDNVLNRKNVSVKTSGSMKIDMGDVIRFLKSENMDIVCVIYKQKEHIKEAYKTIVLDFDNFLNILKDDLEKSNIIFDDWLVKIEEYDKYIKSLSKEYYTNSKKLPQKQRERSFKKNELFENIDIKYFTINPKMNSKQQRVNVVFES